jgi:methylated-DNA-[protein]-cysteine S-methyltransferase
MLAGMEVVRYEAPGWGIGEVWVDEDRLVYHDHPRPRTEHAPDYPQGIPEIPVISLDDHSTPVHAGRATDFARRFAAYFAGSGDDFGDVEIPRDESTTFRSALTDALRAVPRGETVTYGELAALAGRPGAQRAAGSFCAANRFALVVPCHRVVSAAGLGPYGSLGASYKRRLLELEGADVSL